MNAAARLVYNRSYTHHLSLHLRMDALRLIKLALTFGVGVSLLSMVYVTHLTRSIHAEYGQSVGEYAVLQAQHNTSLLKNSNLMAPAVIAQYAENKLHMIVPTASNTVYLQG